ncbi:MAG: arsenate reductase ArsC [Desulfobaccales bacterium]
MEKPTVLFLCTGNTARSQMAEAFLKKYGGDRFEVLSAGYEPKEINPYTKQVMAEAGIDISHQHAKSVKEFLGKIDIRYLIIVCEQAEKTCPKVFPGVLVRLFWPFDDPAAAGGSKEEKLAKFREVRDQIEEQVKSWLSKFA